MDKFKTFIGKTPDALLESGLARVRQHMKERGIGIVSAFRGEDRHADLEAHPRMASRLRELGYGPIQATGRSKWGPERSYIVPGISLSHLKQVGKEFGQQAVIHYKKSAKHADMHYLSGDKEGKAEEIGADHFNTPNQFGVTILKGVGYNLKDKRTPTRSFTFKEGTENECVLEALEIPPFGQLHPDPTPYV